MEGDIGSAGGSEEEGRGRGDDGASGVVAGEGVGDGCGLLICSAGEEPGDGDGEVEGGFDHGLGFLYLVVGVG